MLFHYTARSADGRCVRGSLEAPTRGAAVSSLRSRHLFLTAIAIADTPRGILHAVATAAPVRHSALVSFARSLATLVAAGIPVRKALDVTLERCSDGRLREALLSVASDIENGLSLSDALSRRPREFSPVLTAMVRAGELGGLLAEVLNRIAETLERERSTRKRLVAALTYPSIVGVAAVGVILFLVASIVPMFGTMYAQMHAQLPFATQVLLGAGTLLGRPSTWAAGAAFIVTAWVLLLRLRRFPRVAAAAEACVWHVPLAGTLLRRTADASLSRTLGMLLRAGVGVADSLELAAQAVSSNRYRDHLRLARQGVIEGGSLSQYLGNGGLLDALFVQMVRAGEETGSLDAMFIRLAEYYDVDIETILTTLGSILEPAMILGLGGAVAFIAAAIFIPLYTIIGNLR